MKDDKNSKLPANAGKPWSKEHTTQLLEFLARKSQKQLAHKLERTEEEVFARVTYLAMQSLTFLQNAVDYEAEAFEENTEVNGGDMVEFFAVWRNRVVTFLEG